MYETAEKNKTVVFIIALVIYSLVSSTLTIISYNRLSHGVNNFVDITNNWQSKAIEDIKVFQNYCPFDYEEAIQAQWPGTTSGCWCGDISYYDRNYYHIYQNLYTSRCDWNQTRARCKDIDSTSPISLPSISKISSEKAVLCIKRSNETWTQIALNSSSTCPEGTRKCGSSESNVFCTRGTKCPISHVEVVTVNSYSDVVNCNEVNNCTVLSNDGYSAKLVKYKRGDAHDALPVAQFRLNEYGMCKDSFKDNITPGRSEFALLRSSRSTCNQEGQALWNLTFSLKESELFDLNGVTPIINSFNKYGGYYRAGTNGNYYTWSLFQRSYIPWNSHCRSRMHDVVEVSDVMRSLKSTQGWLLFVTIVSGICLGIILPCMLCNNLNKSYYYPTSSKEERKELRSCGKTFGNIVKIVQFPLQIYAFMVSKNTKGFFATLVSDLCSNAETNLTLNNLVAELESLYTDNLWNIVLLVLLCVSTCLLFVEKRNKKFDEEDLKHEVALPVQTFSASPVQQVVTTTIYNPPTILQPQFTQTVHFQQPVQVIQQPAQVIYQQPGYNQY